MNAITTTTATQSVAATAHQTCAVADFAGTVDFSGDCLSMECPECGMPAEYPDCARCGHRFDSAQKEEKPGDNPELYATFNAAVTNPRALTEQQITWRELLRTIALENLVAPKPTKEACRLLLLTRQNGYRDGAHAQAVYGIEGDYDAKPDAHGNLVSMEDAIGMLESHHIKAAVYPSPRFTPEKPRWRVLAPLAQAVAPMQRAQLVARLNGALGGILGDESFDVSRPYYFGATEQNKDHYKVLTPFDDPAECRCIDEMHELDAIAIGRGGSTTVPQQPAIAPANGLYEPVLQKVDHLEAFRAKVEQLGRRLKTNDGRYMLLRSYIASRSWRGLDAAELRFTIDGIVQKFFDPADPPQPKDIKGLIDWATEKDDARREADAQMIAAVDFSGLMEKAKPTETKPAVMAAVVSADSPWSVEIEPDAESLVERPYPIDALPQLIRDAVLEVAAYVQAPVSIVAQGALAAADVAVQPLADVSREPGFLSGPIGKFFLAVADSGERKSQIESYFLAAINRHILNSKPTDEDRAKHATNLSIFKSQESGLLDEIKKATAKGDSTALLEASLHNLSKDAPKPLEIPQLVFVNPTPQGIAKNLHVSPTGSLICAEAGVFFGGPGMGKDSAMLNMAQLNRLWDGTCDGSTRAVADSYDTIKVRFGASLMVQEHTLSHFFEATKGLARGTGFLARFLVAWPRSTMGTRFYKAPTGKEALELFHARITQLLAMNLPIDAVTGQIAPLLHTFSPEAKEAWIAFYNATEKSIAVGGEMADIKDVVSKVAENAARLAGLFHVFCTPGAEKSNSTPIPPETVVEACQIAAWHLYEARRLFGEVLIPGNKTAGQKLEKWMVHYCRQQQTDKVPRNTILQKGPSGLRKKDELNAAVDELTLKGRARTLVVEKTAFIQIHPVVLGGE